MQANAFAEEVARQAEEAIADVASAEAEAGTQFTPEMPAKPEVSVETANPNDAATYPEYRTSLSRARATWRCAAHAANQAQAEQAEAEKVLHVCP